MRSGSGATKRARDRSRRRAHGAEETQRSSRAGEAADAHVRARVRRLDDLAVADVDRGVAGAVRLRLEEHEVARRELRRVEPRVCEELRGGVVRQPDAELRVDVLREARAVEPGRRRVPAPAIRDAEVVLRDRDDRIPDRRAGIVGEPRLWVERDDRERRDGGRRLRR